MLKFDEFVLENLNEKQLDADLNYNCKQCSGCKKCEDCVKCKDCTNCIKCTDCNGCANCNLSSKCTDCTDCISCNSCVDCKNCYDCNSLEGAINCIKTTKDQLPDLPQKENLFYVKGEEVSKQEFLKELKAVKKFHKIK